MSPNHTAGLNQLQENNGLALRFPRFTGRYRDDKPPEDAATIQEVVGMFRTANKIPAD